jgi:nucleoside phosphorylase
LRGPPSYRAPPATTRRLAGIRYNDIDRGHRPALRWPDVSILAVPFATAGSTFVLFHARQILGTMLICAGTDPGAWPMSPTRPIDDQGGAPDGVTIGILTALPCEASAVVSLLDDVGGYDDPRDQNHYRTGSLPSSDTARPHRVAVLMMSRDNTRSAAYYCANMLRTFPGIEIVIMVGIAGGVPRPQAPERHVRLGDIVVATDGIVDYTHVRQENGRTEPRGRQSAGLISQRLLRAARELQLEALSGNYPWAQWVDPERRPPAETDVLYLHGVAVPHPARTSTASLDGLPRVHHGVMGSGDVLMRDEQARDDLAARYPDVLDIEMEGSGIAASTAAEDRAWFMVRGIADYAEAAGKTDTWHTFASIVAAAYMRALLWMTPALDRPGIQLRGRALPVLAPAELEQLERLLDRLPPEVDLRAVWQATVPGLLPPPKALTTPAAAVEHLAGLNADAGGVCPAVVFVGRLGRSLGVDPVGAELVGWAVRQAEAAGVGEALRARLGDTAVRPPDGPVLLIDIMTDGIDRGSCRISGYVHDGGRPWRPRPAPAGPSDVAVAELEDAARELVAEAERLWTGLPEPVAIEFVMPSGLLHLPVQWFTGPRIFGRSEPLGLAYTVAVRSRERMREPRVRRVWGSRWRQIDAKPYAGRVLWGTAERSGTAFDAWAAELQSDDRYAVVVLSEPPGSAWGRQELFVAFRAGVPVILWDQRLSRPAESTDRLRALSREPSELPDNTKRVRVEAFGAGDIDHFGRYVALLWDDPRRVLVDAESES